MSHFCQLKEWGRSRYKDNGELSEDLKRNISNWNKVNFKYINIDIIDDTINIINQNNVREYTVIEKTDYNSNVKNEMRL